MKSISLVVGLLIAAGAAAAADFETAMDAYERQDYATAAQEFRKLADAGDPDAQYLLGRLYAHGYGVVQDYVEAHKWFNLAASRGNTHAAAARDAIAERMSSSQIAEAQRLARAWQPEAETHAENEKASEPYQKPSHEAVARIQQMLNEMGYDAGPADGLTGSRTRSAIRDYQAHHDLTVDGRPSNELLKHIERHKVGQANAAPEAEATPSNAPAAKWQWQQLLVKDNFMDGDYTANPAWQVAAGQFRVESGVGLRTIYQPPQTPSTAASGGQSPEELGARLLGAIINETTRSGELESQSQAATPAYAEIYLPRRIPNTFAIQLKVGASEPLDRLEFGVYQNAGRTAGYRLYFNPHEERPFHLVRASHSGGSSVIESAKPRRSLERLHMYDVQWTRDRNGEMVVSLEGEEIIRVVDRAFMDPFDGFTLVNRGGDYALRSIAIYGKEKE